MEFLALFVSLPTQGGSERVRLWRALKALGCGTLRDGVYLLPEQPAHADALEAVAHDARSAGGSGEVHRLCGRDEAHTQALVALFDRSADAAALALEARQMMADLASLDAAGAVRRERPLARRFEQFAVADHFPGPASRQLQALMADLRQAVARQVSPGEPSARAATVPRLDPAAYRRRLWATRAGPKVDRLASAWLIRRHIDKQARFIWLDQTRDCPGEALGFDFDGADFSHVGQRVSFETLLASFGLEADAALARIGALVHFLDVGGIPVAEAAGLEAVLDGLRALRSDDDDALLADAMRVFDALQRRFRDEGEIQ